MIEIIGAFILGGVAGAIAKDQLMSSGAREVNKQRELDDLYFENEKYARRNKELERQVEDLLSDLNKARRQAKENDSSQDDIEDELDKAKRELKHLRLQNDELARKLKEYKLACEVQEAEITSLKEKQK